MHGNSGITRPRPHTIQAEANFMTIIQENADRMPNEFRNIGRKRVNNLFVLPSVLNWDHMRDISNLVLHSIRFLYFDFISSHFPLLIGESSSATLMLYRRSADSILI